MVMRIITFLIHMHTIFLHTRILFLLFIYLHRLVLTAVHYITSFGNTYSTRQACYYKENRATDTKLNTAYDTYN
jgi:hypothetical protein